MLNLTRQERLRARYAAMRPGYRPALDVYRQMLDALVTPQTRLLDAGCGPGGLVRPYVGAARLVVGADRYVTHFDQPAEIPTLVESELDALPFAAGSLDLVTCSWVLEHLARPDTVFAEFARVLRHGGRVLLITPNARNYAVWLRRLVPNALSKSLVHAIYGRDEDFINPTYYRANTAPAVERLFAAAGFQRERLEHVGDPTYLALNEPLFRAAVALESLLDRLWPSGRVHLVGLYRKEP